MLLCQMVERALPLKGGTDTDIHGSHKIFHPFFYSFQEKYMIHGCEKNVSDFSTILFSCYTKIQTNEELSLGIST